MCPLSRVFNSQEYVTAADFNVMREALTHGTFESTSPPHNSQTGMISVIVITNAGRCGHSIPRLGGGWCTLAALLALQHCRFAPSRSRRTDFGLLRVCVRAHSHRADAPLGVIFLCAAIPFSSTRMPSRADGRAQRSAVDDLDFRLQERERCALLSESGSSTTLTSMIFSCGSPLQAFGGLWKMIPTSIVFSLGATSTAKNAA